MKSILDPSFKYTPSVSTDIRKTFAKVRRNAAEQKRLAEVANVATPCWPDKVVQLKK